MWLINNLSLQLEWFDNAEADDVRYAILSHTWGADEMSFQDMANLDAARHKAGFAKISKTCELAQFDGYNYTWIDTCCINKESSAELSEAINSMYHWYQAAGVCYAFLSDLNEAPFWGLPDGFEQLDTAGLEPYKKLVLDSAFAKCRWFTRGWTLQELIAPSRVLFFNSGWEPIGDKSTLRYVLETITWIDAKVLEDNNQMSNRSVWRRMSWAAKRKTTRTEDIAYCLLGIFDINMPLLYGEGNKSFQRLQEEITRKEGDPSILLWSAEGLPEPQHRPARYRHAVTPPAYRGAFAWAPSEFLTPEALEEALVRTVRYDATYIAVPIKADMSLQSSCVVQGGVICIMEREQGGPFGTTFGTYLELQTSKGAIYRPVEKMPSGYVFESSASHKPIGEWVPSRAQDVRLLGQHKTMLIETTEQKNIYLGIDVNDPIASDCIAWPEHRWEDVAAWWVYNDREISRVSAAAPTVLGVCQFRPHILIMDPAGGPPVVHQIALAFIVGSLPVEDANESVETKLSHLFGACFVKESNSKFALALHAEMEYKDMDAVVAFVQANLRNLVSFESGRTEVIEFSRMDGLKKRVRTVCTYYDNAVEHNNGLSWRVKIGLEHEDGYGSEEWHSANWGTALPF